MNRLIEANVTARIATIKRKANMMALLSVQAYECRRRLGAAIERARRLTCEP